MIFSKRFLISRNDSFLRSITISNTMADAPAPDPIKEEKKKRAEQKKLEKLEKFRAKQEKLAQVEIVLGFQQTAYGY